MENNINQEGIEYNFDKLCLSCYKDLLAFAVTRTRNHAKAQDAVQEACLRAFKAWSRWSPGDGDPVTQARAWMYRIVSNTISTEGTRERKLQALIDSQHTVEQVAGELYDGEFFVPDSWKKHEIGDEVTDALDRIRPELADVVRLVYLESVPGEEVAKILNIAPGTVRSRMARGRLALARILSPLARQRFGMSVRGDSLAGADEVLAPFETVELEETDADSVDSVVTDDDDSLFGIA